MTLRVPNGGEAIILAYIVNQDTPEDLVLRLFKNDVTPGDTDVVGTYTEADFSGYSAITLIGANWVITPGDPGNAAYAQQIFASDMAQAAQNAYGYYLTRSISGELVYSERFSDGPYVITNNNDEVRVTPQLTLQDTVD